jgi:hypothetical protein
MKNLHWSTITPDMREIMNGFGKSDIGSHFYLAGGTALALQIGHRTSVDLDFFSPDSIFQPSEKPYRVFYRSSPLNLQIVPGEIWFSWQGMCVWDFTGTDIRWLKPF